MHLKTSTQTVLMETSENLEGYNPQEEIKKFWPSKTNNLGDNQKEISLIVLPNSQIFNEVSSQLRKWSALGIIRPFLLINAEDFQLKENETDADILRKNCEFILLVCSLRFFRYFKFKELYLITCQLLQLNICLFDTKMSKVQHH